MPERVKVEVREGVAHVQMVRMDSMNALDEAMFDALLEAGEELKLRRDVRCVVLSGEGRAFCAGLDKTLFGRLTSEDASAPRVARSLTERTHGIANRAQYAVLVWRDVPAPVIAAVHGVAFGGGFQLMLGADLRYVAPDARLSIMELKWGLVPDMGGTVLMRELARDDVVRELTYTARIFSGAEAFGYGFATRTCESPVEAALASAREIATRSPFAVRTAKALFNALPGRNPAEALLAESEAQERVMHHPHHREAVAANLENRPPAFVE